LEARVKTVDAIDATVCVEARASRRMVKSFSASDGSSWPSIQSSCSYCCLFDLIQILHTRYVAAAIVNTPPMTPPAIAPTFGPEFEDFELKVMVAADEGAAAQTVF